MVYLTVEKTKRNVLTDITLSAATGRSVITTAGQQRAAKPRQKTLLPFDRLEKEPLSVIDLYLFIILYGLSP